MKKILKVLAPFVISLLKLATPTLVGELKKFVADFRKKAEATENPWDDVVAEFLSDLLDA